MGVFIPPIQPQAAAIALPAHKLARFFYRMWTTTGLS